MKSIRKKSIIYNIKWRLVGILGKLFVDILFSTTKIERTGYEKASKVISSKGFIFALWHSRILLFSYVYKWLNAVILVSRSEDGEIIARILQHQGQETIRGSTSKGGLRALASMIKKLKEKKRVGVVIPDGPRGPKFKVQPGVITLAKKTGYPIVPVSCSAKKIKVFSSWDRFIIPFPFTKCRLVYGEPLYVPENIDKDGEKQYVIRLEEELCRITFDADRYFMHNTDA